MSNHSQTSGSPDAVPANPFFAPTEQTPPSPPAPAGQVDEPVVEHRLRFVGTGGEYFGIWIVNLLLSILTLGIYSAWAKVRREQYFHRNTLLDGSGFDYHGNPKAIFKGRCIAVALMSILGMIDKLAPSFYIPALLIVSPLIPWLVIRSLRFRARNTSFRGLRFDFHGTYIGFCKVLVIPVIVSIILGAGIIVTSMGFSSMSHVSTDHTEEVVSVEDAGNISEDEDEDEDEYEDEDEDSLGDEDSFGDKDVVADVFKNTKVIAGLFVLAILLSFLAIPSYMYLFKRFQFKHLAFGASAFVTKCKLGRFYLIYLKVFGLSLLIWMVGGVMAILSFGLGPVLGMTGALKATGFVFVVIFIAFMYALTLVLPFYLRALITNHIWNTAHLDKHGFVSDQSFWGIAKVVLSNLLLMALTLGLYWPWAKVKLAAYRATHTGVLVSGDLDGFIGGAAGEKSAVGEEIAEFFDFDISL